MIGSLKASMMGFVTEIMNMYFFETPLVKFAAKVDAEMKNIAMIYFATDNDITFNEGWNIRHAKCGLKGHLAYMFSIVIKNVSCLAICRRIKRMFKIKIVVHGRIEVSDNLTILAVKVPYTLSEVNKSGKKARHKIEKAIMEICVKKCIDRCIVPEVAEGLLGGYKKSGFSGKILYAVLTEYILKDICKNKRRNIRDADIAVIHADDNVLPYIVINVLASTVKFITLVTNNRERIEKKVERVCDETGLSVGITDNIKKVLNNCDFVINYGNIKVSSLKNFLNSDAIVINYGMLEDTFSEPKHRIISKIDIGLHNKYLKGFEEGIFNFYNPIEIAEIVVANKIDKTINDLYDFVDYMSIEEFKKIFNEEGFFVKGYS